MAWVDLDYYKNEYLLGSSPNIPDTDFPFWERQAEVEINWKKVNIENPQNCLKQCICEVAEILYKNNKIPNKNTKSDVWSVITKYLSNTEYHNDFIYRGL